MVTGGRRMIGDDGRAFDVRVFDRSAFLAWVERECVEDIAYRFSDKPELVVADAGYWHQTQMENVINKGIQVLIPPDAGKRKDTRPGWQGGQYTWMRYLLATERGHALYRKRQVMIEPVFAQTKFNRRIDRFRRRGRGAVRSEWRLIAATHNLLKLHKHQIALAGG
jgi:Transposase DDE domain